MKNTAILLVVLSVFLAVSCAVNKETVKIQETKVEKADVKEPETKAPTATFTATETNTPKPAATAVPTAAATKEPVKAQEVKAEPTAVKKETPETEAKPKATLTDTEKTNALIEKIRKSQESRTALSAGLIIDTVDGASGGAQQIEATVIIKKKDKFIVKYTKPAEQLLVSDGKTLWVYTPQLEQAIKQKIEDANLNMNFYVEMETSLGYYSKLSDVKSTEDEKNHIISMKPKKKGTVPFDTMEAGFSKETLLPSYMNAKSEGMDIKVKFINAKAYSEKQAAANPDMDDINFIFRPPQGTEVIEGSELLKGSTIIK